MSSAFERLPQHIRDLISLNALRALARRKTGTPTENARALLQRVGVRATKGRVSAVASAARAKVKPARRPAKPAKPASRNRSGRSPAVRVEHDAARAAAHLSAQRASRKPAKKQAKASKTVSATRAAKYLKPGDFLANVWSYSMQIVKFYRIMSIERGRVDIAYAHPVGNKLVSGDFQNGTVVPKWPGQVRVGAEQIVYMPLDNGEFVVGSNKIQRGPQHTRIWDGKPISVYGD